MVHLPAQARGVYLVKYMMDNAFYGRADQRPGTDTPIR